MKSRVKLLVDGMEYSGWTSVDITAGIERQCREFTLGITWNWPGNEGRSLRIQQGQRCQLYVDDELLLTGFVFATPVSYNATTIIQGASGRSVTADLVDCSAELGQWREQSVFSIAKALASVYKVDVIDEAKDGTIIPDHQVEPGETVFESIDRLLQVSALLSTDDAFGRLVLARPGTGGNAYDALELGVNVFEASTSLEFSNVFSDYECIGQRSGTDEEFGIDASEVTASAVDSRVSRYRKLLINPSGQVTTAIAQRRVNWECGSRVAKALNTTYTVMGWRQSNGDLWLPNTSVRVVDPLIGFDRSMLIHEVNYLLNEDQGERCVLSVAPLAAFEPEPHIPEKDGASKKSKKSLGDDFEYLLPVDWENQ